MFVDFNILNQLGSPSINSNTFANRPAAGQTGRLFVSTDTYEIYRDNGTTWDLIGGPGSSTVTGTGAATQVAYWTAAQAIGGSNNLWWDNTNGFLGVGTAAPTTRIEAVKTDGIGIYANFTTNAGSGSGTTGIYSINNTASSGYAAVIEERTPNTTGGQYPLLVKHSLSAGTAAIGMGTGLQFQLPDDAGTFKTTQLTIETIDAAAATYKTRYRFNVQNNGSSTPVAYINSTGVGVFTATPSSALDIHSTGIMVQLNSTSATTNSLLAFQRSGSGLWRIGDSYNGGSNYFELHNTVLGSNAMQVFAATNKTSWQATETYTTGLARGNYFDYNLSVAAGGSFSSPNAITALGASLDLTLAGNATIPSGARSGLDAYNSISFTGTGTLTHNQGTQIRAYSNVTAGWAFGGSATGTITHLAGLRALFPDNSGSAVTVTNNYALLLNDQTANTGTVTYTNRWGVYQEGASDLNYFAANTLIGTTVNSGYKLDVNGSVNGASFYTTSRYIVNSSSSSGVSDISLGSYANGLWINTPSGTTGYLAVAGSAAYSFASNLHTWYTDNGSGILPRMTLTAAGLFGIGTTTPVSILDVLGGTASSSNWGNVNITTRNAINAVNRIFTALRLQDSGSGDAAAIGYSYNGTGYDLELATVPTVGGALTERVRITSAGLVGIGTSTPTNLLNVSGTGYIFNLSGGGTSRIAGSINNTSGNLEFGLEGNTGNQLFSGMSAYQAGIGTSNNTSLNFATNTSVKALITSGGNFLIGTTTDAGQKLQVNGTAIISNVLTSGSTTAGNVNVKSLLIGTDGIETNYRWQYYLDVNDNLITYSRSFGDLIKMEYVSGAVTFNNTIKTGAPTTGTAATWKLGSKVAAAVTLDTNNYIEVEVGGVFYKLAIVT